MGNGNRFLNPKRVGFRCFFQTDGTVAAVIGNLLFPEITQLELAQTPAGSGIKSHLFQPFQFFLPDFPERFFIQLFVVFFLFNHKLVQPHIRTAVQENAPGRRTVPSCPSGFLIIAFQIFRHIVMNDKGYVGFVDSHAEGVGGHHHSFPVIEEVFLILLPLFIGQPSMIPGSGNALFL